MKSISYLMNLLLYALSFIIPIKSQVYPDTYGVCDPAFLEDKAKREYIYDDVRKNLNALKNMGCKLGIISDGYKVSQRNKVKKLKADKLFDKIIITDELGRDYWKPDERSFVMMMGAFDLDWDGFSYRVKPPDSDRENNEREFGVS